MNNDKKTITYKNSDDSKKETKGSVILGTEPIPKLILSMAGPAIVGFMVITMYNIVDTAFISRLGKSQAAASVFAFPIFLIIGAMGLMIGVGSGTSISRVMGSGDTQKAERIVSTGIVSAVIISAIITILGVLNAESLLRVFGSTDSNIVYSLDYSITLLAGSIFTILNMTMNNMLRGEGSAKYSMYSLMTGAIINVVLDPIFMFDFGLGLGIKGASMATVISQAISTILLFSFYIRGKTELEFKLKNFTPTVDMYSEILRIGLPTFVIQMLMSISITFINYGANKYGDAAVASIGIALRIMQLGSMFVIGFAQGYQPVAGYNFGAKNYSRVTEARKYSIKWTTIFSVVFTIVIMISANFIISLFNPDPEIVSRGSQALRSMYLVFPAYGYMMINNYTFQALGRSRETMILSIARQGLLLIPLAIILPRLFGFQGVVLAQPMADLITILITKYLIMNLKKYYSSHMEELL